MKENVKLIEWLLFESGVPAIDINRSTGMPPTTISDLRKKKSDIMKMRLDNAIKLTKFAKQQKEMEKMDCRKEMENLQKDNAVNGRITVYIYENKEELLEKISQNADDPKETYAFMKEELDYLDDEKTIYSVDLGNGMPTYYDDAKEAYDSM